MLNASVCILFLFILSACTAGYSKRSDVKLIHPEDLLIVDCLLPSQVRQLGTKITYLSPRRPIRTSASMCALRGGEYIAYQQADFESALKIWQPLAEKGDPQAQTYVGEIYENGLGTDESFAEAANWFQLASEQNYARAKINLGYLYETGLGVEKDLAKALNLYREASGFTDGSLEYVSSVDLENREAARIRKDLRENLMFDLEQQLKAQMQQLEQQRTKIDTQSRTIKNLQSEILEKSTQEKAPDQAFENDHLSSVRKLESELEKRNNEFSQQQIKLALLQSELNTTQQEYETLSRLQMQIEALSTPTIEIIDPPLRLGKTGSLLTINADAVEDMIGKVSPVNSIFALRINGMEHKYSENGLFRYSLPKRTHKSVDLLAISQSGEKSHLSIEIRRKRATAQGTGKTDESATFNNSLAVNREVDFGNYHALLIGNEHYPLHDDLPTSVADVDAIGSLLRDKYGFKISTLKNATRLEIISAFDKLRSSLTAEDNLVVYYAGISKFEQISDGYWLPVDAEPDSRNSWIAHRAITDLIDSMAAKHVLLISNSRFSGLLSRSSIARALPEKPAEQKLKWQKAVSKSRVRTVLSTESSEPVTVNEQHSQLAGALIKVLGENEEILEAYELFIGIQQGINSNSSLNRESNLPYYYSPMKHAGHEAGEFLFVPDQL